MKNVFDVLKESHEKQRLLLDALLKTSGDSPSRQSFYTQLKNELEQHAVAEERAFYAPLMEFDSTIDMTRHGIAEHHTIDKILTQLDQTPMDCAAWLAHLKTLNHKVLHHLEEEEQRFFQQAGKAFSEEEKTDLAQVYLDEMAQLA